jgi:branched-subunit amino acid aminotransferase/4-amino-4-deoxychorismate lyase
VAERQPLEQQRGDAVEVLLCTRGGHVLEGLVTNLFVVAGTADAPVVWTAGMQDGVVWGTVRAQVLHACHQLGIPVREEAPDMARRHEWREAFVTNGLRVVQPLSSIACGQGNAFGHQPWELLFPAAPGPVTSAINDALMPLMPVVDAADL